MSQDKKALTEPKSIDEKEVIETIKTIGFIGTGLIGSALARLSVAAGFNVILSNSRGTESLNPLIEELGSSAKAGSNIDETISASDIVIAPLPLEYYKILPTEKLAGKIVIDTMNYYPTDDFHIKELDDAQFTSSELVQQHLKDSKVVKAFHNVGFHHLFTDARPKSDPERTTIPIAGDNDYAKQVVANLIAALGYDTIDTGSLKESWRIEPGTPIYYYPYAPEIPKEISDEEAREIYLEQKVNPISIEEAKKLVDEATRKFPIGGRMDLLPNAHISAFIEFTKKRF